MIHAQGTPHFLGGLGMDDTAKLDRAIRLNVVSAIVMLSGGALGVALLAAGVLPSDGGSVPWMGFAGVIGLLQALTAWSLRRDRDDPAGIERRFGKLASAAVVWAAVLLLAAALLVVGIIAWGLLR
jgi:hypothetical protein